MDFFGLPGLTYKEIDTYEEDILNDGTYVTDVADVVCEQDDIINRLVKDFEKKKALVYSVDTLGSCLHEVAMPPNMNYTPFSNTSSKPCARVFPFVLDAFQTQAIHCIEQHQSVLVAAHTSAGKTAVAEYAIAKCLRAKQRVIYTTPIKALSNQKYREFSQLFNEDVGLVTGDVTQNMEASCLVMTTEILQGMLYQGAEVTKEVAWVIFDEVHYMRDKERGRVWEETIVLLSDAVRFVFLSATIPNALQFAQWIAVCHNQPCNVVYTEYRPVPLQHFIHPAGGKSRKDDEGNGLHLIVDEKGEFHEASFNAAMQAVKEIASGDSGVEGKSVKRLKRRRDGRDVESGKVDAEGYVLQIVKLVVERNMEPLLVFSFSKKECETYAMQLTKRNFNNSAEQKSVETLFNNAISMLSDEDRKLQQIENALPLLKKGIGIHHSGLLPIVKETVELLFGEGLLKCLFTTETFAMGLNMPARTVVFTSCRKFDGSSYRWISTGEYIQMAGRAGRRGKDAMGTVVVMVREAMSPPVAKQMIRGVPDALNSAYRVTYHMMLNLMRREGIDAAQVLSKSFCQFQRRSDVEELIKKREKLLESSKAICIADETKVSEFASLQKQYDVLTSTKWSIINRPEHILRFLTPGRVISLCRPCSNVTNQISPSSKLVWGIVVKASDLSNEHSGTCVINCITSVDAMSETPIEMLGEVISIGLECIRTISTWRLTVSDGIKSTQCTNMIQALHSKISKVEVIPELDPILHLNITDASLPIIINKLRHLKQQLAEHPIALKSNHLSLLCLYEHKQEKDKEIALLGRQLIEKCSEIVFQAELRYRKRVLKKLGYCTSDDVVTVKGRVACQIQAADELMISEMLFDGVFSDLSTAHVCALLSCFVFTDKVSNNTDDNISGQIDDNLKLLLKIIEGTARRIAVISKQCKVDLDEQIYVDSFKPHLMSIAAAWCEGQSFAEVCALVQEVSGVYEGAIVRSMRRLEELLRQCANASEIIGNMALRNKFEQANKEIKRGIIFAASLYT